MARAGLLRVTLDKLFDVSELVPVPALWHLPVGAVVKLHWDPEHDSRPGQALLKENAAVLVAGLGSVDSDL